MKDLNEANRADTPADWGSTTLVFSSLPCCRAYLLPFPLPAFFSESLYLCAAFWLSGSEKSQKHRPVFTEGDYKGSWDVPAPRSHFPVKPKRIKNKEQQTCPLQYISMYLFVYLKVIQFTSEEFGHRCMISVCEVVSCINFQKHQECHFTYFYSVF